MSYNSSNRDSGSRNVRRNVLEFGRTFVVMPKGTHTTTIVWLHGIGEKGSSWTQILESLPLPHIKWICPSAPTRPVTLFGGYPCTACPDAKKFFLQGPFFVSRVGLINLGDGSDRTIYLRNIYIPILSGFNTASMSEDDCDSLEGLEASAAHVANLLTNEPDDVKLGVAGFSMGASVALYSATCRALGQYGNGNRYPINLSAAVALSGWLPCSRVLRNRVGASQEAGRRAASLPVLLCHGRVDDVVDYKIGEKSAQTMYSAGFQNLTFRTYNGLGHYTMLEEINDVCSWLIACLGA